ncbi:GGDEF domain-containing protein [Paenibacillus sp. R14(2021)]|uniref:GGDEF domain-containing protein n=1 Tax=Paenibacillus sp. R14(2021) TaxID=2859228 RepID=UPI001C61522B|nr:GGDEF domain-containing protein [Paenibacillus sp. R14(2021)]
MIRRLLEPPVHMSFWNRRVRISYWCLGILFAACILMTWPVVMRDYPDRIDIYVRNQVLIQSGSIFAILIAAELLYKIKGEFQNYLIITVGSCYAHIVLSLNSPGVHGVQIVMILPLLISTLYFEYGKVAYACFITVVPYACLTAFTDFYLYGYRSYDKAIGYGLVCFVTLICLAVVNRGLRIITSEETALINEEKHRQQRQVIHAISRKDALTGLNNHKTFQEKLWQAIKQDDGGPLHLALIDLDNFKSINDTFGHLSGDAVLRHLGRLIDASAEPSVFTARYGGEEFAVIFSGMETGAVQQWLERLRADIEQAVIIELGGRRVTVSIGCHRLLKEEDKDALFRMTDEALYRAKRSGKNRIAW